MPTPATNKQMNIFFWLFCQLSYTHYYFQDYTLNNLGRSATQTQHNYNPWRRRRIRKVRWWRYNLARFDEVSRTIEPWLAYDQNHLFYPLIHMSARLLPCYPRLPPWTIYDLSKLVPSPVCIFNLNPIIINTNLFFIHMMYGKWHSWSDHTYFITRIIVATSHVILISWPECQCALTIAIKDLPSSSLL